MSIFSIIRHKVIGGLDTRERNITQRLGQIQGAMEEAQNACAILAELERALPVEIARLRALPLCPYVPALWGPNSIGADIDSGTGATVQSAEAIQALTKLQQDLPRLKQHWSERLLRLQAGAAAPFDVPNEPAAPKATQGVEEVSLPEIVSLEGVNIAQVFDYIEEGRITAVRALELERASKRPRPSLLAQLEIEAAHETTP